MRDTLILSKLTVCDSDVATHLNLFDPQLPLSCTIDHASHPEIAVYTAMICSGVSSKGPAKLPT